MTVKGIITSKTIFRIEAVRSCCSLSARNTVKAKTGLIHPLTSREKRQGFEGTTHVAK
jgi:hypothetical protein